MKIMLSLLLVHQIVNANSATSADCTDQEYARALMLSRCESDPTTDPVCWEIGFSEANLKYFAAPIVGAAAGAATAAASTEKARSVLLKRFDEIKKAHVAEYRNTIVKQLDAMTKYANPSRMNIPNSEFSRSLKGVDLKGSSVETLDMLSSQRAFFEAQILRGQELVSHLREPQDGKPTNLNDKEARTIKFFEADVPKLEATIADTKEHFIKLKIEGLYQNNLVDTSRSLARTFGRFRSINVPKDELNGNIKTLRQETLTEAAKISKAGKVKIAAGAASGAILAFGVGYFTQMYLEDKIYKKQVELKGNNLNTNRTFNECLDEAKCTLSNIIRNPANCENARTRIQNFDGLAMLEAMDMKNSTSKSKLGTPDDNSSTAGH